MSFQPVRSSVGNSVSVMWENALIDTGASPTAANGAFFCHYISASITLFLLSELFESKTGQKHVIMDDRG